MARWDPQANAVKPEERASVCEDVGASPSVPPMAPTMPAGALSPEVVVPVAPGSERRSSARQARERLLAAQLPAVERRVWLMENARDEAVALRAATDLNVHGGLVVPQVSVSVDAAEAYGKLSRMLGAAGVDVVELEEGE
jgi:hypothetical protein